MPRRLACCPGVGSCRKLQGSTDSSPAEEACLLPWLQMPPAKPSEARQLGALAGEWAAVQRPAYPQAYVPEVDSCDAILVVEAVDAVASAEVTVAVA